MNPQSSRQLLLAYATLIKKEVEKSGCGFVDKVDTWAFLKDELLSVDEDVFDAALQYLDDEGIVVEYDTPDFKDTYLVLMPSEIQIAVHQAFKARSST